MITIAICDDTPRDLSDACEAVRRALPQDGDIRAFSSWQPLLQCVENGWEPDVAILDIQMPEQDGICLARELCCRCPDCRIIFLTNYLEYATDVYDVRHSYFILKSQLSSRIGPALNRALEELPPIPSICFWHKGELHLIPRDKVCYMERHLRKTYIFSNEGCHETSEHPQEILERIRKNSFCQCHQSFWVNLNRVSVMSDNHFRMDDHSEVPISRSFHKAVRERFFAFLHQQLRTSMETV